LSLVLYVTRVGYSTSDLLWNLGPAVAGIIMAIKADSLGSLFGLLGACTG